MSTHTRPLISHIRVQHYALLTLIFLVAAAGRIANIDGESLWVDEGFSYWTLRQPTVEQAWEVILRDVHPPVYFFLLRVWSGLTGLSELALRYFSVLPSLLSVAVVYQIARELCRADGQNPIRQWSIPLLAALMMALADMENYIAQETRMYTWHVLWAALCMWAFLRWARTARRGCLLDWGAAAILLLYTHYIGICTLIVQGLYTLVFLRGRARMWGLVGFGIVGAAFLPWVLLIVSGQTANIGTGFNVPSTLESLWNWRDQWFTQQWALMIGLALLGLWRLSSGSRQPSASQLDRPRTRIRAAVLLLGWFVLPVALTYLLNLRVPILMDYRLTQITPAVALMIAFGLGYFRSASLVFLTAVIIVYGITIDDTHIEREPWREIGQFAAIYAQPGDLALAHVTPSGDWQMVYYFDRLLPAGTAVRSLRQWQLEDGATYSDGLPALLRQHSHVWLMHWSKDMTAFEALNATGHTQTMRVSWDWVQDSRLDLYRFDTLPPESSTLATWENAMRLRHAVVIPDQLRVDLWWDVACPNAANCPATEADYTVSALLLDSGGRLVAQLDSYPFAGERPTSRWAPGEVVYDPRLMQPAPGVAALLPGEYTVGVKIYRLTPDGFTDIPTSTDENYAVIGTLSR